MIYVTGYSLLFKYDCQRQTPLDLAKPNSKIAEYFRETIEAKEKLDLTTKSILNVENHSLELLRIASGASMTNHDTLKLKTLLRSDEHSLDNVTTVEGIVCPKDVLLLYKEDQDQFSKLRKLLQNLARNQNNPVSLMLWNYQINPTRFEIETEKNPFQTHYLGVNWNLSEDAQDDSGS